MLSFDEIRASARLSGLDGPGEAVLTDVTPIGPDALNVVYRGDETVLSLAAVGCAFTFDADGEHLRLASEALRIRLAHLFDPYLAVTSSRIEALPHQITAVHGEILPRQPLRFLLADDPGAGKTIMAGLLIKELMVACPHGVVRVQS